MIALWMMLILQAAAGAEIASTCNDEDCQAGFECRLGRCSNNPYQSGCLQALLPGWTKPRVCNSDDPPNAAKIGLCRLPDNEFDYMEIRILTQNRESVFFSSWLLQILLSELLDIPTTLETGTPEARLNFYHPSSPFEYGTLNDWSALERATELHDCRLASRHPASYQTCAHVIPEVWTVDIDFLKERAKKGLVEQPPTLGALIQESWYVPQFTVDHDASVLTYFGLAGEENRRKLAEMFLRPTTWRDYCEQVSVDNCTTPDSVAQHAPVEEKDNDRFFVNGVYVGHFRKTEDNDCDKHPTTCTGHIADYPCAWNSYIPQQTHHLNIALKSEGPEPTGGYRYEQLRELWHAANATKSHIMMIWWKPDGLYREFAGTDAAFTRVTLPDPTLECMKSRSKKMDRCGDNFIVEQTNPLGACDTAPQVLYKGIAEGFSSAVYDPAIPQPLQSPAHDAVNLFGISELQLDEIFGYVHEHDTPREAMCRWATENIHFLNEFVPSSYPRQVQESRNEAPLILAATIVGGIATVLVLATAAVVFRQRHRRVMQFAQIEFLWLLLIGSLAIAVGAVLSALKPPSDSACVAIAWLVSTGYALELCPLIVKVAAINKLMSASQRMKRVVLRRNSLFGTVIGILVVVVVFLITWSVVDPPRKQSVYELSNYSVTDSSSGDREIAVVLKTSYCSSESGTWLFVVVAFNALILAFATILAFETRKVKQVFFNESQTLGIMIYSHALFIALRIICLFLSARVSPVVISKCVSILYSADTIATVVIYFWPKFAAGDVPLRSLAASVALERGSLTSGVQVSGLLSTPDQRRSTISTLSNSFVRSGTAVDYGTAAQTAARDVIEGRGQTELTTRTGGDNKIQQDESDSVDADSRDCDTSSWTTARSSESLHQHQVKMETHRGCDAGQQHNVPGAPRVESENAAVPVSTGLLLDVPTTHRSNMRSPGAALLGFSYHRRAVTVQLPANGPLGITVESSPASRGMGSRCGIPVCQVDPESELHGKVRPGDSIVGFNGVDTSGVDVEELVHLLLHYRTMTINPVDAMDSDGGDDESFSCDIP